jgi:hypothetical protein
LGDALTAKVADIAAPAVTETAQLLELLDVTPPYFALQDIQVSNTVCLVTRALPSSPLCSVCLSADFNGWGAWSSSVMIATVLWNATAGNDCKGCTRIHSAGGGPECALLSRTLQVNSSRGLPALMVHTQSGVIKLTENKQIGSGNVFRRRRGH